jgi:hypothetical protein
MVWMCVSKKSTFETADPLGDIGRVVRVHLDTIVLAEWSDIREEHRECIGTCELDELSCAIVGSDVDPSLRLCVESRERRIIEISEIAY